MKFYAYIWLRTDGTPYYVGKGCNNRAFTSDSHRVYPPKDLNYILIQYYASEKDALFAERFLIAAYGRVDQKTGLLRNLTDGGEGERNESAITKELRRQSLLGNKRMLGKKRSEETKRKIGESNRGRVTWITGKKWSAESIQKRVASRKATGWKHTDECKQRMRDVKLGKKMSEEFKEGCRQRMMGNTRRVDSILRNEI